MHEEDSLLEAIHSAVERMDGRVLTQDSEIIEIELGSGEKLTLSLARMESLVANGTETVDGVVARFLRPGDYFTRQMNDSRNQKIGLRLMLERIEILENAPDVIHKSLSDQVIIVLSWMDPEESGLVLLSESNIADWSVTVEEAWKLGSENMNLELQKAPIEILDVGEGRILGMLATDSPLKASLVLAPGLKQHVERHLGWPIFAVIPCRDFVYLIPGGELGQRTLPALGQTVVEEYDQSPYSLSTEVFQITDGSVKAIGAYAEPA